MRSLQAKRQLRGVHPLPARQAGRPLRGLHPLPSRQGETQLREVQPLSARQAEKQLRGLQRVPAPQAERRLCGVQPLPSRQGETQLRGVQSGTRGSAESKAGQARARERVDDGNHRIRVVTKTTVTDVKKCYKDYIDDAGKTTNNVHHINTAHEETRNTHKLILSVKTRKTDPVKSLRLCLHRHQGFSFPVTSRIDFHDRPHQHRKRVRKSVGRDRLEIQSRSMATSSKKLIDVTGQLVATVRKLFPQCVPVSCL